MSLTATKYAYLPCPFPEGVNGLLSPPASLCLFDMLMHLPSVASVVPRQTEAQSLFR